MFTTTKPWTDPCSFAESISRYTANVCHFPRRNYFPRRQVKLSRKERRDANVFKFPTLRCPQAEGRSVPLCLATAVSPGPLCSWGPGGLVGWPEPPPRGRPDTAGTSQHHKTGKHNWRKTEMAQCSDNCLLRREGENGWAASWQELSESKKKSSSIVFTLPSGKYSTVASILVASQTVSNFTPTFSKPSCDKLEDS